MKEIKGRKRRATFLICDLFNDTVPFKTPQRRAVGSLKNDELDKMWKVAVVAYFRYYPGISWIDRGEPEISLSQVNWCPDRDSNQKLSEIK